MSILTVERNGGLAGFGGKNAHLRSIGEIDINTLSGANKELIENLFQQRVAKKKSATADGFQYKLSRTTSVGTESIEVDEEKLPQAILECVKDEIV